jgi:hypothetical protein
MAKEKHKKSEKSKSSRKSSKKEGKKKHKHSKKQKHSKKETIVQIADTADSARVSESISDDDFFRLSEEFRVWLKMAKNKFVEPATFYFAVLCKRVFMLASDHLNR